MDVRRPAVDLGGELVGGAVPAFLDQATEEESPWCRDAMAHRAEEFDDPLHGLVNSPLPVGCLSAHNASIGRRVPCRVPGNASTSLKRKELLCEYVAFGGDRRDRACVP